MEKMLMVHPNINQRLKTAGLKPPKEVTLSITNRCNLRCDHCWPNSSPNEKIPLVPKGKILRLIKEFSDLGVEKIVITGGEPLLHPHWYELLSFASSQPNIRETRLQTNGTLINSSHVDALLSLKGKGLTVQVSIDGATTSIHDRVRGKGSFEKSMKGLQQLVNAGMAHIISIAFTEMLHNFADIPALLEIFHKKGVKQFITGTLVPGGRALQNSSLRPPTPAQYKHLLALYKTDSVFRNRYQRFGHIAALEWRHETGTAEDTCCECIETPYVNGEGKLYPCCMLQIDEFAATDVYNRPLETAISEKLDAWSSLGKISRLRQSHLAPCKNCSYYFKCKAGCMGRAYTASGGFLHVEDRCNHRRVVYQQHPRQ